MQQKTHNLPKLKAVIFIGVEPKDKGAFTPKRYMPKKELEDLGFKESVDFIIFGDAKTPIDQNEVRKQLAGRIGPETVFFAGAHGGVRDIEGKKKHTVSKLFLYDEKNKKDSQSQQGTSEYMLNFFQELAGKQPITADLSACYGGASKDYVQQLEKGSILISHSSPDKGSNHSRNVKYAVKRHLMRASKPNFDRELGALLDFQRIMASSINVANISISGMQDSYTYRCDKRIKTAADYKKYMKTGPLPDFHSFVKKNFARHENAVLSYTPDLKKYFRSLETSYWGMASFIKWTHRGIHQDMPELTLSYSKRTKAKLQDVISLEGPLYIGEDRYWWKNFFHAVAKCGSINVLEQYFKFQDVKAQDLNKKDKDGNTPLHLAVRTCDINGNRLKVIRLFIEKGADLNLQTEKGNTALHGAIIKENVNIAKLLIEKGADPTIKNKEDKTAIDLAKESLNSEMNALFCPKKAAPVPKYNPKLSWCNKVAGEIKARRDRAFAIEVQ
jgi:hypothetical protein